MTKKGLLACEIIFSHSANSILCVAKVCKPPLRGPQLQGTKISNFVSIVSLLFLYFSTVSL
jgi:hypothetical protein